MSDAWVEAKFRVLFITEQHRQGNDYLNDILNASRGTGHYTLNTFQRFYRAHVSRILAKSIHVFLYCIIWMSTPLISSILNEIEQDVASLKRKCDGNDKAD